MIGRRSGGTAVVGVGGFGAGTLVGGSDGVGGDLGGYLDSDYRPIEPGATLTPVT